MYNWKSAKAEADSFYYLGKVEHCLVGIYFWELCCGLDFEWGVIRRRRPFRWPLIFYFANRYLMFGSMIGSLVFFDVEVIAPGTVNCDLLYQLAVLSGLMSLGLASVNLAIRTIAIWSRNTRIKFLLITIILGHWAIIMLQAKNTKTTKLTGVGCFAEPSDMKLFAAMFIYSLGFDTIVLILNVKKLYGITSGPLSGVTLFPPKKGIFMLAHLIFQQGLIFYVLASVANLVEIIVIFIDLNPAMTAMFAYIAEVTSTLVACRAVRSLYVFLQNDGQGVNHIPTPNLTQRRRNSTPLNFANPLATPEILSLDRTSTNEGKPEKGVVVIKMETFRTTR